MVNPALSKHHFFISLPSNLHYHLETLRFFSNILLQTVRVPKLLDGAKYCRKVQVSAQGATTSQTGDSSNLSFSEHINSIMVKAKFRSNHIIRCFLSKDCNLLTQAFITHVQPLLEYCSPVWSPSYVTLINKIESVQRFFTKRLNGLQSISYDDRLAMLGLERLELRRLTFDLLMCYKIIYRVKSCQYQ